MVEDNSNITIRNDKSTLTIVDDNILYILYDKGVDIEVKDIDQVEKAFYSLPEPRPKRVIQEMTEFVSITDEARNYAAERSPELNAVAYVIKSLSQRMLLKFYIRMVKRAKPTKVFLDFDKALEWVKQY